MISRPLSTTASAVLLLAVLTGCSGGPGLGWERAVVPEETASPEPAPPAAAPEQPRLEELVLSPEGLGPLRIGAPVPQDDPELATVVWDGEFCSETWGELGYGQEGQEPGRWLPRYPDAQGFWGGEGPPFSIGTDNGLILAVGANSPEVTTARGIGIGSSREDLLSAYPGTLRGPIAGNATEVYYLEGSGSILVFEVSADPDYFAEAAQQDVVALLRAQSWDGGQPQSLMGTDAVIGGCL